MTCLDSHYLDRPLKTQKIRDSEEQEKLKKYPKTTIRIRMPDHTIVQAIFQSKERGKGKICVVFVKAKCF